MRLSLDTREVGRVTIVRCNGRIVAGGESESLREHVTWLLRDRRSIVLDLGEVGFIDSSGLGALVSNLRQAHAVKAEIKLFGLRKPVRALFELVRMHRVFEVFNSADEAISSYKG